MNKDKTGTERQKRYRDKKNAKEKAMQAALQAIAGSRTPSANRLREIATKTLLEVAGYSCE